MEQNLVAAFAEENMKTIYAYALSRVSNREDAEDLAGDILLALLSNASRLRDEEALYGFVWSIAGNTYKKFLRRKSRQALEPLSQDTLEQLPSGDDFTEEMALEDQKREQLVRLRRELSLLSWEYRECTLSYYFEGLSCQETARRLGISLDMTKYYLFKTRKLLKEGIGMEREYGTKSYKPAKFSFKTLFSGSYNPEYVRLFDRLLPGNILLSAYYSPVTVRELALELGIPTAYLEDEVALLVKYGLLNRLPIKGKDRYQTNMIIYTEEYMGELYEQLTPLCTEQLVEILSSLRSQLAPLRAIGFRGADMEDDRLLWPLLWLVMHRGNNRFAQHSIGQYSYRPLYADATGINIGIAYSNAESPYETYGFAGYSRITGDYAAAFADFGILPPKNRYLRHDLQTIRDAIYSGSRAYVLLDQAQLAEVE
ncbi:MAG: RNA polymerase sigma factor, partial [Acetatifactor sp.]|nr:RNA polymerase sigma factor [Acetatifactor sp.]